jgi:hypothetical protein
MYNDDSFYAINKLMDFAHGNTIQKQMTQSMNEIIANMHIPGVENPMEKPLAHTVGHEGEVVNEN